MPTRPGSVVPPARPPRLRRLGGGLLLAVLACGGPPSADVRPDASRAVARPGRADAAASGPAAAAAGPVDTSFAGTVARLSEAGGYFDTDNLVSNETSVLHVLGALERAGVHGGAYVGVGPEQNFSYIAAVRPVVAYVIDIRRDNLLQHLWYRALFELADERAAFLETMLGRPPTAAARRATSLDALLAAIDAAPRDPAAEARARTRVATAVRGFGVPLDSGDLATIDRIHRTFIDAGLALRFTSFDRRPRSYYPTLRDLLAATDRDGAEAGFLATAARYAAVRDLERAGRVFPVVGDLAGAHALAAIGDDMRRRRLTLSAFYTSNVEYYLWRDGTFDAFARTLAALPRDEHSALLRSCFGGACGRANPNAVAGHYSVQSASRVSAMLTALDRGEIGSYPQLVLSSSLR